MYIMATSLPSIALNLKKRNCMETAGERSGKEIHTRDKNSVAALPDDWIPRHSGPILANYLKQREQDHQNILCSINRDAGEINLEINKKIHAVAKNLLTQINQNQLDMDCVIEKACPNIGVLSKEGSKEAQKSIRKLYFLRVDDISMFKQEALALERERADTLKVILRDKFQRLVAIGHKTPRDLLHDVDDRIYEINQQILSNFRAFIDLEAQLRVELDVSIVQARSSLNQLTLGVGVVYRERLRDSALRNAKSDKAVRQRSVSADRFQETSDISSVSMILENFEEIDACVNRLVEAYRAAVLKVYIGFCDKFDNLEKDLSSIQYIKEPNIIIDLKEIKEFQNLIEKTLCTIENILSNYNKDKSCAKTLLETTGTDVISVQKSLWSLGECLQNTYSILYDTGHLWDSHILRSALAQTLTIASVEDTLTKHDAIELANEIPINIAMEQLRCSSDTDKLQQHYETIKALLSRTSEMYLQHSEAELGRLEEFMNLPGIMAQTLMSEYELFLEKYSKTSNIIHGAGLSTPLLETPQRNASGGMLQLSLPRAILLTQLQETALRNWRNGFLEAFASNVSLVSDEIKRQAQLWIDERSSSLNMRFSVKMMSHSIRIERLKAAREVRLAELHHHEARLQSHLNAVNQIVKDLPVKAAEFVTIDAPCLYPLVSWIDRIRTNINVVLAETPSNHESRKLKMLSYSQRLLIHRNLFEESLEKAFTEYKIQFEHRFQVARISNVRFITDIKLFSEGGRYAAQEALKTCVALIKASEALETSSRKTFDALIFRRTQLLAYANSLLLPLKRIIEDTVKITIKSNVREHDTKRNVVKKK